MAIRIPIISEFDDKGLQRATRQFRDLETTGQKAQFAIQKAALPAAAALGGLAFAAGNAFKAFAEDQAAAEKLALTLSNVTGASDTQIASVEKFISATSRAAAVADDELRPALDSLIRGTKDVTTAQDLLGLALDISAGTGKDLSGVSDALSKAFNGNFKALKSLDPALASLIKDGASADDVFKALGDTFGGQAAAQANTAEGRMRNLSIQMGELKESIGAAVAPLIEKMLPAFQSIGNWIASNTPLVVALGAAIGVLALAIVGINGAMAVWTALGAAVAAVNTILGTSFTVLWAATGIGIILAIIAAVVLLNQKFHFMDDVINIVKEGFSLLWDTVKTVFGWVYDKIKEVADFLSSAFSFAFELVKGYIRIWWTVYSETFGFAWNLIKKVADFLVEAFQVAIDFVIGYFNFWYDTIKKVVDVLVEAFKTAGDTIARIFKGVVNGIISAFTKGVNLVIGLINTVIKAYNSIPLAPNIPLIPKVEIPKLAEGGIVTGPTVAMIGEAGPEAVIPLDRLNTHGNITVNVAGSVTTERDLIESIRRGLVNAQRNGSLLVYAN